MIIPVLLISSLLSDLDAGTIAVDAGAPAPTMQVEISGVKNAKGHVLLAIYRAQDRFSEAGQTAFRKERVAASAGTLMVEVKDLPAGTYALALIHDENDNLKIDTGLFGIPTRASASRRTRWACSGRRRSKTRPCHTRWGAAFRSSC